MASYPCTEKYTYESRDNVLKKSISFFVEKLIWSFVEYII